MKNNRGLWKVIVPVIALVILASATGAAAQCAPRVDNFFVFVDQSGSMYMKYYPLKGATKVAAAKQVIAQMDRMIAELGYKGGLALFAPFEEIQPLTTYKQGLFGAGLGGIKDEQRIFGRETPMKTGILELKERAVLEKQAGPTCVIMITDGKASPGEDPLASVKQLVEQYPRVAFHVISLAQPNVKTQSIKDSAASRQDEKRGEAINQEIAKLGHGLFVKASDLIGNPAAMQSFVNQVFCGKEKIILRGIQFDFDKSDIKPEYTPILDEALNQLKKWVWSYKLVINGFTDSVGKPEYNVKLSERRANAIRDYFAARGISPSQMKTVGYGESNPVADNKTDDGRALNRRVELDLLQ